MEAHRKSGGRAIVKEWEMKTNCTIECKQVTGRTSHLYFDLLSLSLNKNYNGWRRHRCFTLIWPQYHTEISILLQKIGIVGIHMYVRSRTHKVHVHVWAMPYHAIQRLHSIAIMEMWQCHLTALEARRCSPHMMLFSIFRLLGCLKIFWINNRYTRSATSSPFSTHAFVTYSFIYAMHIDTYTHSHTHTRTDSRYS